MPSPIRLAVSSERSTMIRPLVFKTKVLSERQVEEHKFRRRLTRTAGISVLLIGFASVSELIHAQSQAETNFWITAMTVALVVAGLLTVANNIAFKSDSDLRRLTGAELDLVAECACVSPAIAAWVARTVERGGDYRVFNLTLIEQFMLREYDRRRAEDPDWLISVAEIRHRLDPAASARRTSLAKLQAITERRSRDSNQKDIA